MSLRDLKRYNPHLIGERLPIGVTFNLYLSPAQGRQVKRALGRAARVKLVYRNRAARELKATPSPEAIEAPPEVKVPADPLNQLGGAIANSYYKVQSGDQIWQIAARARISVQRLRELNGLSPLSTLRVGQRLKLNAP